MGDFRQSKIKRIGGTKILLTLGLFYFLFEFSALMFSGWETPDSIFLNIMGFLATPMIVLISMILANAIIDNEAKSPTLIGIFLLLFTILVLKAVLSSPGGEPFVAGLLLGWVGILVSVMLTGWVFDLEEL